MSKKFTDINGREWPVVVTVGVVKRAKQDCEGLDLLAIADGKLVSRLMADPLLLVDVLYSVCRADADAAGITAEQFGAAMAGDAIDQGTTALLDAMTDFFRPGQRETYRAALAKVRQAEQLATAQATADIQAIDPADLIARTAPPTTSGQPSTGSQASAG